jgi:hypothetical protein
VPEHQAQGEANKEHSQHHGLSRTQAHAQKPRLSQQKWHVATVWKLAKPFGLPLMLLRTARDSRLLVSLA